MKSEYVLQLLLQKFCDKSSQTEEKVSLEFFERGESSLICVEEDSIIDPSNSDILGARKRFEEYFRRWILLLMIFCSPKNLDTSAIFNVTYKGIAAIIDYLIDPDRDFVQERGKPPPKPKYSLPTQTNLVFLFF